MQRLEIVVYCGMKRAVALKRISPLIKKGTVVVKIGKYGIVDGYPKRENVKVRYLGRDYYPPNNYPWEQIEKMKDWWKVIG